jgi:hypothetical protein
MKYHSSVQMSDCIVVIPVNLCIIIFVLFKMGYEPRTNIVNDEKGDLFADFHSMFAT